MHLDYATSYLNNNYPALRSKDKENLTEALRILETILSKFDDENLNKLHDIEMINPSYFPGLSRAAASTLCDLHTANPELDISFLLNVVHKLAHRGRPWESLSAFGRIAESCPKQITEDNIAYLMRVNSDILEICSYDIEKKTEQQSTFASRLPVLSYFFTPAEINVREAVQGKLSSFGYR